MKTNKQKKARKKTINIFLVSLHFFLGLRMNITNIYVFLWHKNYLHSLDGASRCVCKKAKLSKFRSGPNNMQFMCLALHTHRAISSSSPQLTNIAFFWRSLSPRSIAGLLLWQHTIHRATPKPYRQTYITFIIPPIQILFIQSIVKTNHTYYQCIISPIKLGGGWKLRIFFFVLWKCIFIIIRRKSHYYDVIYKIKNMSM